jgi:cytoskeletal protein RodZ
MSVIFNFNDNRRLSAGFAKGNSVVCVNNSGIENELIVNKVYNILNLIFIFNGYCFIEIEVENTIKDSDYYRCERFISLKEYRRRKLERINHEYK